MSSLWYKDPKILIEDWKDFFPKQNTSREQKINAIARFAIYYSILIVMLNYDTKWLSISVVLIVLSLFLGTTEYFSQVRNEENENCVRPTKVNPFMNFTLDDHMNNINRGPACDYEDVKDEMREKFTDGIVPDPADLWGQHISDRQFFTMPWTQVINDQQGFAEWLYGNRGECKNLGQNCERNHDNRYHQSRYYRL